MPTESSDLATQDLKEKSPFQRWATVFNLPKQVVNTLQQREGGKVTSPDGIFQVTKATREGSYKRIPAGMLSLLLQYSPILKQKYSYLENVTQFLNDEKNLQQIRQDVLDNYANDKEIQTFWGLWYFSYACEKFGNSENGYYLSFLRYNHPSAVYLKSELGKKYHNDENYGFINQVIKATGLDFKQAVSLGNNIVEAIDGYLHTYPTETEVQVSSLEIEPFINYEKGRDRFFWGFNLKGTANYKGKKIPFILRSAHYLWRMELQAQTSDVVWQVDKQSHILRETGGSRKAFSLEDYAKEALQIAYQKLKIEENNQQNRKQREEVRKKLFDKNNNPTGILKYHATGKGVMDIIKRPL